MGAEVDHGDELVHRPHVLAIDRDADGGHGIAKVEVSTVATGPLLLQLHRGGVAPHAGRVGQPGQVRDS